MKRLATVCLAALALLWLSQPALASPITATAGTSSLAVVEDFESVPSGEISGIFNALGASIGEAFVGQTVSVVGGFEQLSGSPSDPLTLQTPGSGDGLYKFTSSGLGSGASAGLAGGTSSSQIGEGAISILFDVDQSEIGISFGTTNDGTITLDFYARDGSLVDSLTVAATSFGVSYTFSGASFAGVSITNDDPGGIGIDDLRYIVIPEPATLTLFGLGALACGVAARRRRRS